MTDADRLGADRPRDRAPLRVGLVNNMPDAALAATERQFRALLAAAAPDRDVTLDLFAMPEIRRDPAVRARMAGGYRPAEAIERAGLDALIVTGANPEDTPLDDEAAGWPGFGRLVDLAARLGLPTVWSCLAAHAAVRHLDGIPRRPLATKHAGVFACDAVLAGDPLLAGLVGPWRVPHSRLNALDEADLAACGYRILTRSPGVGVDVFARGGPPLFLFFQGHPEYDGAALAFEYKRDFRAYLQGLRDAPPAIPINAFDAAVEQRLAALAAAAARRRSPELMADWPVPAQADPRAVEWRAFAVGLYANWLRAAT
jgi:homoserine O-succinyltransferase